MLPVTSAYTSPLQGGAGAVAKVDKMDALKKGSLAAGRHSIPGEKVKNVMP